MKKILVLGLIVLSIGLVACGGNTQAEAVSETEMPKEPVKAEKPKIEDVQAFGIVDFTVEQSISVDFNARVDKIHVKEGERIKKGDPLVDFDISELTNNIASKKMEIDETKFDLSKKDYSVDKLKLDLKNSEEELAKLEKDYNKKKTLFNEGAVSEDEYTKLKDSIDQKKRLISKLKLDISSTSDRIRGEKNTQRNTLSRLEDELKRLEDKYSKANFTNGNQIVSTIENGVVTKVDSNEGAYVNRENNVMTIVDLDSRIVRADIAEEFIGRIKEGQKAIITSQAVPGKEYKGEIVRIWGTSIKKGGETIVPIEIEVKDLDDKLFLNFNVDVKIKL